MQSTPIFRISSAECLLSGVACLDYSGHRIILTQQNRWCQWAELGVSSRLGGGELLGKYESVLLTNFRGMPAFALVGNKPYNL